MSVATVDPTDTLAVLKMAREWLSDPKRWTTGGYRVPPRAAWRQCNQTCGVGALIRAHVLLGSPDVSFRSARGALERAADDEPISVNDGPDGYAKILAAYDKAIATLGAQA